MGKLINKKALITAGKQGIGKAITIELIKAGCDVFVHYFSTKEGEYELRELAIQNDCRVEFYQADLTKPEEVKYCVIEAVKFLGGLNILINNAGGLVDRKNLSEIDAAYWQNIVDLNVTSMLNVTKEATPHLAQAGEASIVNLASLAGRKGGHAGSLAYSICKGAVLTMTRALANELGPSGIRVNAVAPGLILGTQFHNKFTTKESVDATIKTIPLGRAARPDDVARPVVFLASEYDGFINGATLDINGGVYCA